MQPPDEAFVPPPLPTLTDGIVELVTAVLILLLPLPPFPLSNKVEAVL